MKNKTLLTGLLLATLTTHFVRAGSPPAEKLLGPDTLVMLSGPDWSRANTNATRWPVALFWNDPAMKPFREKISTRWNTDVVQALEKQFGVRFADYTRLARGQITLALLAPAQGSGAAAHPEPGFLFIMDSGSQSNELQSALTKLKKTWVDQGNKIRTEKIRDVEFSGLVFSPDDLAKSLNKVFPGPKEEDEDTKAASDGPEDTAKKQEWLLGQAGSLLIAGLSAPDIEKVLVRHSGGSLPSLAEEPKFSSQYGTHFRDALAYGWVNLKSILDLILKEADADASKESAPDAGMPGASRIVAALGLSALQSASFSLADRPDGQTVTFAVRAPGNPRKGLLKMLSFDAKDSAPPPFVPADVVKFSRWRLDLKHLWDTLESTLSDLSPQMAGIIKLVLESAGKDDKNPDFDLRQNLIGNLGDDIISYQKAAREETMEGLTSPPSLVLIGSPRAEKLAAAMKALSSLLPQQSGRVKEREFLGRTVYTLSLPAGEADAGKPAPAKALTYVASGNYVAISTDTPMVEEFLRGAPAQPLRDTPRLNDVAQQVGGMSTGFFGYENDRENLRVAFSVLKKNSGRLSDLFGELPLAGQLGIEGEDKSVKDWIDFTLLPPFDQVSKYFDFSVYGLKFDTEGLSFKAYTPRPPGVK